MVAMCREAGLETRRLGWRRWGRRIPWSAYSASATVGDLDVPAAALLDAYNRGMLTHPSMLDLDSRYYQRLYGELSSFDEMFASWKPDVVLAQPDVPSFRLLIGKALQRQIPVLLWANSALAEGSVVLDKQGSLFFPSRSEGSELGASLRQSLDAEKAKSAASCLERWREARTAKCQRLESGRDIRLLREFLRADSRPVVCVAAQPNNLASASHLGAQHGSDGWLRAVAEAVPSDWKLVVKLVEKSRPSDFSTLPADHPARLRENCLILRNISAPRLLSAAQCAVVLSSLMGVEAILAGTPTVVCGLPFYRGGGLSIDLDPDLDLRDALPEALQKALSFRPSEESLLRFVDYLRNCHIGSGEKEKLLDWLRIASDNPLMVVDAHRPFLEFAPEKLRKWPAAVQLLRRIRERGAPLPFGQQAARIMRKIRNLGVLHLFGIR